MVLLTDHAALDRELVANHARRGLDTRNASKEYAVDTIVPLQAGTREGRAVMAGTIQTRNPRGREGRTSPAEELLFSLEARHASLCAELAELEARLRTLRTAAEVCELCGGAGERWIRGGLYGELHRKPCPCQPSRD